MKIQWFWGLLGLVGILGFILDEPLYYIFFVFFLFFLGPALSGRKEKTNSNNGKGKTG